MRFPAFLVAVTLAVALPSTGNADEEALRRIVGQYGWDAIQATAVRAALPADAIAWLDTNLHTSPRTELVEGRYLIITGCRQHACAEVGAFVAIDVTGGGWLTAMTETGRSGVVSTASPNLKAHALVQTQFWRWVDSLQ